MTQNITIEQLKIKLRDQYYYHREEAEKLETALNAIANITDLDFQYKVVESDPMTKEPLERYREEALIHSDNPKLVFPKGIMQPQRVKKLRDLCIEILQNAGNPLGVSAMVHELSKMPVDFNYKALSSTIFASINKDKRFERIDVKGAMTKWKLRDKE